jgi:uncharacterized protein YndB with AHSA1/START domain
VAVVTKRINTSPDRVWAQLADGWIYTGWVVGATHIRDVDDSWPAVGSQLHHQVGAWPATISDTTQVIESDPTRRLVLQARAWPVGEARVVLELEPDGDGTVLHMGEEPTDGAPKWLQNPVQDALLKRRNAESLARLAVIAEKRRLPGFPQAGQPGPTAE